MLVMKFGGTSVANASAIRNVLEIIGSRKDNALLVVVSACAGVTDKLIDIVIKSAERQSNEAERIITELEAEHLRIIDEIIKDGEIYDESKLALTIAINEIKLLSEGISLLGEYTSRTVDSMAVYGELLSSMIVYYSCKAKGFNVKLFDAREVIKTNDDFTNAGVLIEDTRELISSKLVPEIESGQVIITQGFIGSTRSGISTTLGRGGSDYSASLIGNIVNADEIHIWTDVSGILTADPRLVSHAQTINKLTYESVKELSFFGAKVLHPDSIKPAIEGNIPVRVLNTFEAKNPGSVIVKSVSESNGNDLCFVLNEKCFFIKLTSNSEASIFSELLSLFEGKYDELLYITGNKNSISLITKSQFDLGKLMEEIKEEFNIEPETSTRDVVCAVQTYPISKMRSFSHKILELLSVIYPQADLLFFTRESSVLVLLNPGYGRDALEALHQSIF